MIKLYLKQAWQMMKQNKLFTGIYVMGTGLSIAMVMTLFIIFYVKCAPIYPEYNRNRTMVIKSVRKHPKGELNQYSQAQASLYLAHELLPKAQHAEEASAFLADTWTEHRASAEGQGEQSAAICLADWNFWRVFTFDFLHGKPYTEEDVKGGVPVAVISRSFAGRLFAQTDVVGRRFTLDGFDYRVCGVVEDVSNANPLVAAEVWRPYGQEEAERSMPGELQGNYYVAVLASSAGDVETLKAEVDELVRKVNAQDKYNEYDLLGQPELYWKSVFRKDKDKPMEMAELLKEYGYLLLALLFIPALNLCGMISSRMDRRLCELGVRKAYGACRRQLLGQVLAENLLLTCMGGMTGLLLSYSIVLTASDWILTLFDTSASMNRSVSFTSEMLFNPVLFGAAFGVCATLNVVSALVPAAASLRKSIVESLHSYRN